MQIASIGSTTLVNDNQNFYLNRLLPVPKLIKNLVGASKFCADNGVALELNSSSSLVKEQATSKMLMHGKVKDGLYSIPFNFNCSYPVLHLHSVRKILLVFHLLFRVVTRLMTKIEIRMLFLICNMLGLDILVVLL